MTDEAKRKLLLKDICGRLPYGVKLHNTRNNFDIALLSLPYGVKSLEELIETHAVMPYLRPMSSMTEEEKKELHNISVKVEIGETFSDGYIKRIDYLNAHHFDYRGLIAMGLALEALKGMYN